MQATPGLRRHGGRLLTEPLRGTVEPSTFFTFLAGHRSSLRACIPGFRGISSLHSGIPRPGTTALPVAIDFSRQKAKKIVGGEEQNIMSEQVTVYADAARDDVADTMAVLENVGITYTLIDLTQDENALQHVEELGFTQTPIVEAGTTSWAGFRPDLIHALATSITLDTYDVPTDPMDSLSCDSCQ